MNLPNDIESCHELIKILWAQNQELLKRVAELEARLNQNSQNSNRPPSSDGLSKKPAFPRKRGKKRGGQLGDKGKTLKMVSDPDYIVVHSPKQCSCGRCLEEVAKQTIQYRQVFDLPEPKLKVTEHQLQSCICPDCKTLQLGQFPSDVAAAVQYGAGVRSLVVLLNNGFKLSYAKIRQFFCDVFGYELNESTQVSANQKCYQVLAKSEQRLIWQLLNSKVNHFDETGLRVNGKLHWLHNCSNRLYTYLFIHARRGKKALKDEASLIRRYSGWAIHDCWASYFKFDQCRHGVCGAHLLRELQSLVERGSVWADRMHDLLLYAYAKSNNGKSVVPDFGLIRRQYERICEMAGCFRTVKGAQTYARILSFIATTRKHQLNVFNELVATFNGYNFLTPLDGAK